MRIAVFGGTFDPPHLGHRGLARAVVDGKYAEKVLFVPSFRPPHKTSCDPAPFADRVKMLALALEDFAEAEISEAESRRPDSLSYTLDTMNCLTEAAPGCEYVLLIGEDSLAQLHTWHRAQELAEHFRIIAYPRPGYGVTTDYLRRLWPEYLAMKLELSRVDLPVMDISSSSVREIIRRGGCPAEFVSRSVLNYIEEKQLYR